MPELPKTVWVTKYAVDEEFGLVYESKYIEYASGGTLLVDHPLGGTTAARSGDYAPTREAALARAEEMRAAKITSLKRQIERLKALEF